MPVAAGSALATARSSQATTRYRNGRLLKEGLQSFWAHKSGGWGGAAGPMVPSEDALSDRVDEGGRQVAEGPQGAVAQLVWREEGVFQRGSGRLDKKGKLVTRKTYGLRTLKALELSLYHGLGTLSEPIVTHRFS